MTRGRRADSSPGELLERDRELADVDALIAAAAAEQGSFLVLEGRSGLGKSALLAEVRRRAAAAGLAICSAVGSELEAEFALGVVRQLFEPRLANLSKEERTRMLEGAAALAEPLFDIGADKPAPDRFAALHGLYWLVANLAARAPLLVAVDDAHWADVASLRWLAYLLNRLEGLPMLVAIATRPPLSNPQGEVLATILAHAVARILPVGPLGEGAVASLIRTTLGSDPDPVFTAACLRATAGNALALNELLRELRVSQIGPTAGLAGDLEKRAPDAITRRVQRDLSLLGKTAERLAGAVAVLGDGAELRLTARLADLEVDRAAEAADELFAADILASERPPRFAHPLLRAAVYDQLPAGLRQKMHRRAAEILRSDGADPEAVAAHLLRCYAGRNAETIEWLKAAAPLALRRGAPEAAVSYLRRALAEGADEAQRTAVLAQLGKAELADGDPAAIDHLREALAGTSAQGARAAVLTDLATALICHSDEQSSRDRLEQALEEFHGSDEDAATRVECIVMGLSAGDPRVAPSEGTEGGSPSFHRHYPRLRELALGGTPSADLARATLAYLLSYCEGNRDETLSWARPEVGRTLLSSADDLDSTADIWLIQALLGIDQLKGAAEWCTTVIREGPVHGNGAFLVGSGLLYKAYAELRMGLLAEAEADAAAALEFNQQHLPFNVPMASAYLAEILFERGRHQAAYQLIEGISLSPAGVGGGVEAEVREIRGRLRWARGWRDRGVDDLRASGSLCELHQLRNPIIWPWRVSLATALAQDCPDEGRRLVQENLLNARRSHIPRAIGVALRTRAELNQDEPIELLRAAIAELQESPGQLDLARALADLGGLLRRNGHRVEAREPLREALEIAARCGAVPLMERVQAEAVAAGARPRRRRLRGIEALTASELRVARLAAEGRSNREIAQALFITTYTVADHLGSTYSKLDITSREQLAAALLM